MSKPLRESAKRRIEGLRNLRTGYGLVAAVGFQKSLHGEDLIEEYASLAEQAELSLYYVKQAIDSLGWAPFDSDVDHAGFIEEYGNAGAYLMSAQSTLREALGG